MAKRKSSNRMTELPKGYKPISGLGGTWDYKSRPFIEGVITSFKNIPSKKFFEGTGKNKKPKIQRLCNIMTDTGEVGVWESAGTRALFDLKVKTKVAVLYQGDKKIPGRAQKMHMFQVGVA